MLRDQLARQCEIEFVEPHLTGRQSAGSTAGRIHMSSIRNGISMHAATANFTTRSPIASVCHGVEIPAAAGCVEGRRMATVPKCKFDLEVCGGVFVDEACVVDGNLVSGRTYHDHGHYMGAWIELLAKARDSAK